MRGCEGTASKSILEMTVGGGGKHSKVHKSGAQSVKLL
jgi:hypothetical protein